MLRVRGLTQDDAHIFCTAGAGRGGVPRDARLDPLRARQRGPHRLPRAAVAARTSKSDKYVGSDENWEQAEAALRKVLSESGQAFTTGEGEAAFYGPKADFWSATASAGSGSWAPCSWTTTCPNGSSWSTSGRTTSRIGPVMIHRAPFGSLERFVGVLIEHFAGAFPLWLAPEQVRVLPLSEKTEDYAHQVVAAADRRQLPGDDRSAERQGAGQDSRRAARVDPVHDGRRAAGSGNRRRGVARSDRRRPGRHAAGRRRTPGSADEVDNKTIRQVVASKFAAVDEGGEQNEY